MRVGVEICTYNRASELGLLLQSLREQTFQDFDLYIIDESEIPSVNYEFIPKLLTRMKLEGHNVVYQRNTVRRGIGHARNLCNELNPHELCCRIDDDSVCASDYLESLEGPFIAAQGPVGAVGGLVPVFGAPNPKREARYLNGVFNKITFKEGKVEVNDDGGLLYYSDGPSVIDSDHLRSSFMYRKSAAEKVGLFPDWCGTIGWREETVFCMKLKWAGYKLYTNLNAICWHNQARSGGARMSPQDYMNLQGQVEEAFQHWSLRQYRKHGNTYG